MTRIHTIELEGAVLFFLAAAVGVTLALYTNHSPKIRTVYNLPVVAPLLASPTPTQPPLPKTQTFSQVSPDGKKKLSMVASPAKSGTTYAFSVEDTTSGNSQPLYSITLPETESMTVPFNAFSPDDRYVFLTHVGKGGTDAWVFRVDASPILADGTMSLDMKAIFDSRATGNTYQEATGWASETLVIVNTATPNGTRQSYWIEIPSKALIPLSTQF